MSHRPSNGAPTALFDLTGTTDDSSSDGDYGPPPTLPTLKSRRTTGSPLYESEEEDYINGILLAPATGADVDAGRDNDDDMPLPKPTQRRRRVLAHSDEDVEPDTPVAEPESSSPVWDKTGPSLHHDAAEWRGNAKGESGTPPWDRTGPSLHQTASKRPAPPKSETPPWDRTGPSLHHQSSSKPKSDNQETPSWDRTGPSLYQSTMRAKTKSETPFWDKTGPSLYRSSAKGKGKAGDGIDWGNDRFAVVIDTPKSWFERQAQARKLAGVKVATERSAARKPARRRIVEVVIPVPRRRAAAQRKEPEPVSDLDSDISLGDIINKAPKKKTKPPPKPGRRRSPSFIASSDDDDDVVYRRKTPKKVLTKKRPRSASKEKRFKKRKDKRGATPIPLAHGVAPARDCPERLPSEAQSARQRDERDKGTQYASVPVELPTSSESGSEDDDDDDDDSSGGSSDFIVEDGPGNKAVQLPEEFTVQKQPWQYKFKVVFQYLVLLVVKGEDVLPLPTKDAAYFSRPVREVRSLFTGIRNSVAGQVWPAKYRKSLEKYPRFNWDQLKKPRDYCSACARHKQRCFKSAFLGGEPYRRETHRNIHDSDDSYSTSEDEDYELGYLGNVCFQRTQYFHEVAHWEHKLYLRIRSRYHDLLRAKGKQETIETSSDSLRSGSDDSDGGRAERNVARARSEKRVEALRRGDLPKDVRDVNEVTEWFDRTGFQKNQLHWLNSLETRGKELERDLLK